MATPQQTKAFRQKISTQQVIRQEKLQKKAKAQPVPVQLTEQEIQKQIAEEQAKLAVEQEQIIDEKIAEIQAKFNALRNQPAEIRNDEAVEREEGRTQMLIDGLNQAKSYVGKADTQSLLSFARQVAASRIDRNQARLNFKAEQKAQQAAFKAQQAKDKFTVIVDGQGYSVRPEDQKSFVAQQTPPKQQALFQRAPELFQPSQDFSTSSKQITTQQSSDTGSIFGVRDSTKRIDYTPPAYGQSYISEVRDGPSFTAGFWGSIGMVTGKEIKSILYISNYDWSKLKYAEPPKQDRTAYSEPTFGTIQSETFTPGSGAGRDVTFGEIQESIDIVKQDAILKEANKEQRKLSKEYNTIQKDYSSGKITLEFTEEQLALAQEESNNRLSDKINKIYSKTSDVVSGPRRSSLQSAAEIGTDLALFSNPVGSAIGIGLEERGRTDIFGQSITGREVFVQPGASKEDIRRAVQKSRDTEILGERGLSTRSAFFATSLVGGAFGGTFAAGRGVTEARIAGVSELPLARQTGVRVSSKDISLDILKGTQKTDSASAETTALIFGKLRKGEKVFDVKGTSQTTVQTIDFLTGEPIVAATKQRLTGVGRLLPKSESGTVPSIVNLRATTEATGFARRLNSGRITGQVTASQKGDTTQTFFGAISDREGNLIGSRSGKLKDITLFKDGKMDIFFPEESQSLLKIIESKVKSDGGKVIKKKIGKDVKPKGLILEDSSKTSVLDMISSPIKKDIKPKAELIKKTSQVSKLDIPQVPLSKTSSPETFSNLGFSESKFYGFGAVEGRFSGLVVGRSRFGGLGVLESRFGKTEDVKITKTKAKSKSIQLMENVLVEKESSVGVLGISSGLVQIPVTDSILVQAPIVSTTQVQQPKLEQIQKQKLTTRPFSGPITPISPRAPTIPFKPIGGFGFGFLLPGEEDEGKKVIGYNVSVKQKGGFVKINKQPYTRRMALNLGAEVTDKSTARTFRITPTNQKIKASKRDNRYFSNNKKKFRQFRQKQGTKVFQPTTFIEKSKYALDSPTEKKKITAMGVIANIRATPQRRAVKRRSQVAQAFGF